MFDVVFNPFSQATETPPGWTLLRRFGSGDPGLPASQHSKRSTWTLNQMHSRNILLTKLHLSVKHHEMQFCYSEIVCHLQKNVNTVGASVMFEIEMHQESRSSSVIQTERREIHYQFHKQVQTLAMQMSSSSLRSTYTLLVLSMPAEWREK